VLADRAFISSLEMPREIDCRRWIDMHTSANLCSETAKQKSSPTETRPGTESEKRLRKCPKYTASHLARCVLFSPAIFFNIEHASSRDQRSEVGCRLVDSTIKND
jgi:hypothetical protein